LPVNVFQIVLLKGVNIFITLYELQDNFRINLLKKNSNYSYYFASVISIYLMFNNSVDSLGLDGKDFSNVSKKSFISYYYFSIISYSNSFA